MGEGSFSLPAFIIIFLSHLWESVMGEGNKMSLFQRLFI
jgi:hypothetical protein